MTPQEAINIIEDVTWQDNGRHYGKIAPAREIAISALEKQIPKKVIPYNKFERHCECGAIVKSYCKYCYKCGQALDWGDTE